MNRRLRLLAIVSLAASSAFVLSACSEVKSEDKQLEEIVTIPVIAEPVMVGSISASYGTTASLEAASEASVTGRLSGIVTKIFVEEGDYVQAGQALAQLDVDKLELEVQQASARFSQTKNDLNRNKKMFNKGLISSEAFDRVKFDYDAQKAATDLAKLNLEYATIRASISGVIAIRYIKEGNLLKQNDAAFHITDLSEILAIIHIPESEKAGLAVGQLARIFVEASVQPFIGIVQRISPIIDRDSGTIRVTVSLSDESFVLRPGMFSRVSIIYDTHQQAILVPKDSIITEDSELSVYIVEDGVAHKRLVAIGFSNSTSVEILQGVEENEMVITTGQRNLRDKAQVEIIEVVTSL
ncbi:MAG: efflux transporter periplasmic adaptor subunit [Gammaproteobacteria bacterium]|nr:MAG: efflux transporter periplasmic adaptor subunit [Gammaproteobacteria bacterium]